MGLNKVKLGEYIIQSDTKNTDNKFGKHDVKGIATSKVFIPTKANLEGVSLSSYKVVAPHQFAYVSDTSRRGDKISLAYNDTDDSYIVSSISTVFGIKEDKKNELLPEFLFLLFNRPEFDRYARFNSWGSARETFSWEDFCDIELELPPIEIQQKYVDIYDAMLENQQCYEEGLEDLKLVCDAYINNLDSKLFKPIKNYIERNMEKNQDVTFDKSEVKGFNNDGEFIKPMRLFSGDISTFKVIKNNYFVYNSRVNSTIKKLSIALNEGDDLIVTPAYETFYVSKPEELHPYYLYMLLQRESFARKVLFNSFGSATLVFDVDSLGDLEIPVPSIDVQKSIANIYKVYKERKAINDRLKEQLKDLCPLLVKGAIEEAEQE